MDLYADILRQLLSKADGALTLRQEGDRAVEMKCC